MVAPGQRLLATGNDGDLGFADLSYRHEDSTWCQRHTVCLSGWVITAQATEAQAEEIFAIATRLARRVSA
jgi:hypothetical protein